MTRGGLLALLALGLCATTPASEPAARAFALHEAPHTVPQPGLRLRGSLDLTALAHTHPTLVELSGLAWDADEEVLYAVSDRGHLLHLRPRLREGRLVDLEVLASHALRAPDGRTLRGRAADAEGLVARGGDDGQRGNTELLVAFERQHRISVYDPQGRWRADLPLPVGLRAGAAYASPNKSLEAIALHPRLGVLSAPEYPLLDAHQDRITVYAASGPAFWLPRLRASNAGLVALEALPDGRVLSLERSHSWLTLSIIIRLQLATPPLSAGGAATIVPVAEFDSTLGWRMDNFEGLTRHQGAHFFMVSDDNASVLQKTLLVYFELTPPPAPPPPRPAARPAPRP